MVGSQVLQGYATPVRASARFGRSSLACRALSALDRHLQCLPWSPLASVPRFPPLPCALVGRSSLLSRAVVARAPSMFMRAHGSRWGVWLRAPKGAAAKHGRSFLPPCFASRSFALPPQRGRDFSRDCPKRSALEKSRHARPSGLPLGLAALPPIGRRRTGCLRSTRGLLAIP